MTRAITVMQPLGCHARSPRPGPVERGLVECACLGTEPFAQVDLGSLLTKDMAIAVASARRPGRSWRPQRCVTRSAEVGATLDGIGDKHSALVRAASATWGAQQ